MHACIHTYIYIYTIGGWGDGFVSKECQLWFEEHILWTSPTQGATPVFLGAGLEGLQGVEAGNGSVLVLPVQVQTEILDD